MRVYEYIRYEIPAVMMFGVIVHRKQFYPESDCPILFTFQAFS